MKSPLRNRARRSQSGGIIFRLLFLVLLVVLVAVLYFGRRPLLRFAGNFWVVNETPENVDAIVILGDDNYPGDRATKAAELYKEGRAPRVVASGEYLRPYASIAELEAHDLQDRGVPSNAIVPFAHHAHNTREECAAIRGLLVAHGWKRILLVTSTYHTFRARYICERELPAGTFLRVISAPDSDYNPDAWWQSRAGSKIFLHEALGMVVALWEERHNDVHTVGSSWFGFSAITRMQLVAFACTWRLHSV